MSANTHAAIRSGCAALIVGVSVAFSGAITGCVEPVDTRGNTRSYEPSTGSMSSEAPTAMAVDVADHRNVLPDGLYEVTVDAASCDVNETYRRTREVLLFRSRAGQSAKINLPLPWRGADDAEAEPRRQDLDLSQRQVPQFLIASGPACGSEADFDFVEITELTPTRLGLSFQRMAPTCPAPEGLCTIRATFELLQRSCDPSCDPQQIIRVVSASGLDARCTCADAR